VTSLPIVEAQGPKAVRRARLTMARHGRLRSDRGLSSSVPAAWPATTYSPRAELGQNIESRCIQSEMNDSMATPSVGYTTAANILCPAELSKLGQSKDQRAKSLPIGSRSAHRPAAIFWLDAVGKAGAGFKSLADTWAGTTTPHGRLMLSVLGGLAEFERELIKARTEEGRKRTQARGSGLVGSSN
jgi:hypothetical protein